MSEMAGIERPTTELAWRMGSGKAHRADPTNPGFTVCHLQTIRMHAVPLADVPPADRCRICWPHDSVEGLGEDPKAVSGRVNDPSTKGVPAPADVENRPGQPPAITIVAYGRPAPQGSKRHVGGGRMKEQSEHLPAWREAVKHAALFFLASPPPDAPTFPLDSPLAVSMTFTMRKPKSAPKTRRTWPAVYPDLSKLARGAEDALSDAGLWRDDALVVEYVRLAKVYPGEGEDALQIPGVIIRIWQVAS